MKKIYIYILLCLFILATNAFSIPVDKTPQINLSSQTQIKDNLADLQRVIDSRTAYWSFLSSMQSYDCSFGSFAYYSYESAAEHGKTLGISPSFFQQLPVSRIYHAKRQGERYYEYYEKQNTFLTYLVNNEFGKEQFKTDFYDTEKKWTICDSQKSVGLTNCKLRSGKSIESFEGLIRDQEPLDLAKPYSWETSKPWSVVNQTSLEKSILDVLQNEAVITGVSVEDYHSKPAIHIKIDYPKYDGADYFILSLDDRDYGQPLYVYEKSGCNHCADLSKRTVIWETVIDNIEYDYFVDQESKVAVPVPKSYELVYYKNKRVDEVYHTVLFDCQLNTITKAEDLFIPFPDTFKLSVYKFGEMTYNEMNQKTASFFYDGKPIFE